MIEKVTEFLNQTFWDNTLWQYLLFLGIIVFSIILGKIFYFISKTKLRKVAARSKTKLDDILIDIIEEPIVLLIVTVGIWVGSRFLELSETFARVIANIVQVLLVITVTWFFLRLVDMLIKYFLEPLVAKSESKLDDQILPILRKSSKTVIMVLAVIVTLSNMGYDILSILAGLSIGGLALALAAQDAVKNLIGGISIFWDKPFQIDEYVNISGVEGTVAEVGLRSTRLQTLGGTTYIIPNSKVADSILQNYSTRKARRMVINIGLVYETTAARMKEAVGIIKQAITSVAGAGKDDILVRFVNFGDFSLDLEVVYWIVDMNNWKTVIHDVNMKIKEDLDGAGIEMAFPTETHYVIKQDSQG